MKKVDKEKELINNVKEMLKEFMNYYIHLPDSQLKKDFLRFLNMVKHGKNLNDVMMTLETNILNAKKTTHNKSQDNSNTVILFWEKILDRIKETYRKNLDLMNS